MEARAKSQSDTRRGHREGPLLAGLSGIAGWRSREQIEAGEYGGIEDLAQAVGVDRTYAGRMLRLTSLAPDIIEAVLRGKEPGGG